jgi:hypothetical protein
MYKIDRNILELEDDNVRLNGKAITLQKGILNSAAKIWALRYIRR